MTVIEEWARTLGSDRVELLVKRDPPWISVRIQPRSPGACAALVDMREGEFDVYTEHISMERMLMTETVVRDLCEALEHGRAWRTDALLGGIRVWSEGAIKVGDQVWTDVRPWLPRSVAVRLRAQLRRVDFAPYRPTAGA